MDENHSAGSEIQRPQYGWLCWPGSEPSTLEIDVYVQRYVLLVVLARNDDDDVLQEMETSIDSVYAIGDIAQFPLFIADDAAVNIQHWQMAHQHGTKDLSINDFLNSEAVREL